MDTALRTKPPLRSQPTRDRILAAARKSFATEGFERTTIRSVASMAGIHPSMVMRYYGTKEGLFAAAAVFDLQLPDLTAVPRQRVGVTLIAHLLDRWEDRGSGDDLPALLRLATTHEGARARLIEIFHQQVAPAIARVCASDLAFQCAVLISTQTIGLAFTRHVLKLPAVVAMSRELLIERIGSIVQASIDRAA